MTFSIAKANVMPLEETYVGQYNSVMVKVPVTVKYKHSEECSVKLRSHKHNTYSIVVINDTLFIKSVSKNFDEICQLKSHDCVVILRHPNRDIINEISIDKRILRKSGNPRK